MCDNNTTPRRIRRSEHADRIEVMTELLEYNPDSMVIRRQTVGHPLGIIKLWMRATLHIDQTIQGCQH